MRFKVHGPFTSAKLDRRYDLVVSLRLRNIYDRHNLPRGPQRALALRSVETLGIFRFHQHLRFTGTYACAIYRILENEYWSKAN